MKKAKFNCSLDAIIWLYLFLNQLNLSFQNKLMLFLERILLKEFRKLTIYNNSEKPFGDDKIETRLFFLLAAFFPATAVVNGP